MLLSIYANDKPLSQKIKQELLALLDEKGIAVADNNQKPTHVITIGGDGTLLSAFHNYLEIVEDIKFIGLHTGHLGFYADWQKDELHLLVDSLDKEEKVVSYPLLEITFEIDGARKRFLALNEFSLRTMSGTMVCDVYIKDIFFERFRGDGLCIATPSGSTGLNKSLGGAVIHPSLDAIQMTEMASLNNRLYRSLSSPIIIPKDEWFTLEPASSEHKLIMMIDHLTYPNITLEQVKIRQADKRVNFATYRYTHYWDRVENSFIGEKE